MNLTTFSLLRNPSLLILHFIETFLGNGRLSFYCPAVCRQGVLSHISKDFRGSVLSWHRDANGRVISLLLSDVKTKIHQIAPA